MPDATIIAAETHDNVLVLNVTCDSLDEEDTKRLQDETIATAEQAVDHPVALDLSRLVMMPSLSLGALVNLARHFKQQGRRFFLLRPQREIRNTLAITRLDRMFEIYDGLEELQEHLNDS